MNAAELIAQAGGGQVLIDLDDAVVKALEAMRKARGKATLTIKLDLTPISFDDDGKMTQFAVAGAVNEKLPKKMPEAGLFFVGKDGKPSKRNPVQPELPIVGQQEETPKEKGEFFASSMTEEEKQEQRDKTA